MEMFFYIPSGNKLTESDIAAKMKGRGKTQSNTSGKVPFTSE